MRRLPPRSHCVTLALGLVTLATLSPVAAQQALPADYPARPIRVVTPNAPGSSIDTLGRIVAQRLGETLGQSLLIENRAGAGAPSAWRW